MIQIIEKSLDIRIQDPAHFLLRDRNIDSVQDIVLTAPRAESIAEPKKVLFVDGLKQPHY
ncbi:MAG: hypothetical protein ABW157_13235 [Candidatus Thiodiazotropha sp. LLP2]